MSLTPGTRALLAALPIAALMATAGCHTGSTAVSGPAEPGDVPVFGNMIGGNALQNGIREGVLTYRLLRFRREPRA